MPDAGNVAVVVTRPSRQAENLCKKLTQQGISVLRFPVIEIKVPLNTQALKTILGSVQNYDLAIFISANAVEWGLTQLPSPWPESVPIAAIGLATANAISAHGLSVNLVAPKPYNSESLLGMSELQNLTGQKVLVIRGEGGREHLAQTLRQRGAEVEYAECYRRARPEIDTRVLHQAWAAEKELLFVVTSNEGLQNLFDLLGQAGRNNLLSSPLVVVSERTANEAKAMGFTQKPLLADSASDEAILNTVKTWIAQDCIRQEKLL